MKRSLSTLMALAVAALALAACGGDDGSSPTPAADESSGSTSASGGAGGTIDVAADPNGALAFTEEQLTARAGENTINLENQSSTPHNVEIEDQGGNVLAATDTITGSTTSTTADLEPGIYTYFCDVPGHREAGMEGTLTVK